ncbi:MAG: hypothetical protein CUN48_18660 [Candidatus Thermofonsia Clade 3 bacterium]|uniref:Uncharacterized protein n=1 Tax=Candidatus Thermofonsia Clade 3 bacterium TaxID=2364212 RepID=A0A2M8Q6Q1_9CHLR|nr:MAG: hypothetical protein CUN48_18660 [Candidatus Thermofonsia Clade 3 bacterium]
MRVAARKSRVNDFNGNTYAPWFRPPGYGVVDLAAWWQPMRDVRITAAVNNLFDKKYWLWGDIRQADARNPAGVDFYSQPGRNLTVTLQADF